MSTGVPAGRDVVVPARIFVASQSRVSSTEVTFCMIADKASSTSLGRVSTWFLIGTERRAPALRDDRLLLISTISQSRSSALSAPWGEFLLALRGNCGTLLAL